MGKSVCTILFLILSFTAYAFQSNVLFSIGDNTISSEEFSFFYNKNSQNNPEAFTKTDIEEYLKLFIDFKLKVTQARDLGYDTTASFKSELKTYLDQLSDSFLNSNELEDELIREAYSRMQYDVNASHILIRLSDNPLPSDTLRAFNRAMEVYDRAVAGENFNQLAATFSEEPGAVNTRGQLGFFTVFQMVYPFETAAYSTAPGSVSTPVRTQFGYHVVKVNSSRPAMGTVEVAHIMIRFNPEMKPADSIATKQKVYLAYEDLMKGIPWDSVCFRFSEDINSKSNGGKLRPFGVRGLNVPEFEQMAYETPEGEISKPFMTPYGWHILKVIRKNTIGKFEDERTKISRKVQSDSRSRLSEEKWINKLKSKHHFEEYPPIPGKLTFLYDTSSQARDNMKLFSIENKSYSQTDLKNFAGAEKINDQNASLMWYGKYVRAKLKEREEELLLQTNLEFRMLRKEYYEGILLFSIMEDKVWEKAASDSVGLKNYFLKNGGQFAVTGLKGIVISVTPDSLTKSVFELLLADFTELDSDTDPEVVKNWVDATLNTQSGLNLQFTEKGYREGDPSLKTVAPGINLFNEDNKQSILILGHEPKTWIPEFGEIKGLVMAAYQDLLEKEWIDVLHQSYKVKINQKALKKVLHDLESR